MFTKVSALTLAAASLAAAVYTPIGDTPSGNAFTTPARAQVVPACKPFSITWAPSSSQKISILLLRGPSENVVPIGAPLADSIDNTGSFSWTPSADLEADVTHYGLRIIQEDGKFQWSDQFGVSKDGNCKSSSSSASASASAASSGSASAASVPSSASTTCTTSSAAPSITKNATSIAVPTSVGTITAVTPAGTGSAGNTTIVSPTIPMSVPETLKTSATPAPSGSATGSSTAPGATGAAGQVRAGLGLVAALGGLALML